MTTVCKIGIFGDSYSYEGSLSFNQSVDTTPAGTAWVNLLKNDFDVTNFSVPGSSLYFSYYNFIKNYNNFDKVIFVFTLPGRISLKHPISKKFIHLSYWHGLALKEIMYPEDKKIYNILSDYMKHLHDEEKEEIIYNLMVQDIFSKCHSIIPLYTKDLMTITEKENNAWDINFEQQLKINDIRHCHLTKENNEILYKKIKHSILNSKNIDLNLKDFDTPLNKETYLLEHEDRIKRILKNWSIK